MSLGTDEWVRPSCPGRSRSWNPYLKQWVSISSRCTFDLRRYFTYSHCILSRVLSTAFSAPREMPVIMNSEHLNFLRMPLSQGARASGLMANRIFEAPVGPIDTGIASPLLFLYEAIREEAFYRKKPLILSLLHQVPIGTYHL